MAELKRKEEELTTADLAGTNTTTTETESRPQLVRNEDRLQNDDRPRVEAEDTSLGRDNQFTNDRPASETLADHAKPAALFSEGEVGEFRNRWSEVQTGFVDEPRRAVENADNLVASLMKKLAEGFANERAGLEKQWDQGTNVSTEDLRVALQRYRSFFDRLLKV
jgi:hypothetical protein